MNCPNKNDAFYIQTVQVLGEELAHVVYKRNNYQFLDRDSNGNDSKLFKDILESVDNNASKAILMKANLYSSLFSSIGQYAQTEPTIDDFNNIISNSNKLYAKANAKTLANVIKKSSEFSLLPDGSYYVDKAGNKYERQSNYLRDISGEGKIVDTEELLGSLVGGDFADSIARDLFAGTQPKNLAAYINEAESKNIHGYKLNITEEQFDTIKNTIQDIKDSFPVGTKFFTDNIIVAQKFKTPINGAIGVAGALDILAQTPDGNYHIIDTKTKKVKQGELKYLATNIFKLDGRYEASVSKWAKQQTIYQELIDLDVDSINIMVLPYRYTINNKVVTVDEVHDSNTLKIDKKHISDISNKIIKLIPNKSVANTVQTHINGVVTPPISAQSKKKAVKVKSIALLIKELNKINAEIFNEKDDDVFKQSRRKRRDNIKEDIALLKSADNTLTAVIELAKRQFDYFQKVIDTYNPDLIPQTITVSEIATMTRLLDIWLNIKDILPVDMRDEDDVLLVQSKFDTLKRSFFKVQVKAVISETVINEEIKEIHLTTNLEDRGLLSKFFLNSGRSANLAIQNINKLMDIAKNNTIRKNNQLKQKLFDINTKIARDKIDISNFIEVDKDGTTPYLRLVTSTDNFYKMEKELRKKKADRGSKKTLEKIATFYRNNAITFNIKDLFDYNDITGYTSKTNHEDILKKLADTIDTSNRDFANYLVRIAFDKQQNLLSKYHEESKLKEELLYNGSIQKGEYDKWILNNNPQHFYNTLQGKEVSEYINNTYSVSIPTSSNYINEEFIKIFENEKALEVYHELYNVLKELKRLLPANIRNSLSDNFLPIVNESLVREGLTYLEEVQKTFQLPNFSASDNITDYKEIPLRFIPENSNDLEVERTLKNRTFSTDLIPIISLLGESIHHYYHFTQVKAPILLTQAILSKATPYEKDYKGDKKIDAGIDLKHEAGQGLNNEMELLNETINHVMFLEKSKPEFALGAYYEVEDLDGISEMIKADRNSVKVDVAGTQFHVFSLDELDKEQELVNKIQINLDKNLKTGKLGKFKNKISNFFEKLNKQYKGEEYVQIENLFNLYLAKQDEAREMRRNEQITLEQYQDINNTIFARLKELQRKTIYGSKIGDTLIKTRRTISLGLNPFSAGRNYVGGYTNALVNGGQEYDNGAFTRHMVDIVKLNVSRHFADKERAFKIYKIAKTLLVDNELIDLQGLDEKDWFSKYGFVLMEKSEKAVRYSLMLAILEKSNILNLTDKDNLIDRFDEDGNFINNPDDTDNTELNDITLKIQRVNDIVMGDTHSFKLINKHIAGRLIGQFKSSWMPEIIASRLESEQYDYKLNRTIKGRYITYRELGLTGTLIGLVQSYQSLFFGDNDYIKVKNSKGESLSETDVINMKRNAIEAGLVLGLLVMITILRYIADDEEDDAMLTFLINQLSLVERDLTTVSPTTLTELIGGNLIPAYTVVTNLEAIIPATVHIISDDKYSLDKYLYKLSKVIPVLNIGSQFKYQSEHFVDDLN